MKNKLLFAGVIFILLFMGVGAGSIIYSAFYVASRVHEMFIDQWLPYASNLLFIIVITVTFVVTYNFIRHSRKRSFPKLKESDILPMTIIIPALNEEKTLETCVKSILNADYPKDKLEIIIAYEVDPKCKDCTPSIAKRLADTYPNVRAIPNNGEHSGSKAGAINNCINVASGTIMGIYDADHVVEKEAILRACSQFVENPGLDCIGGKVMVRNMDYNLFTMIVGNEYTVINNYSRFISEIITGTHLIYGSNVYIKKDTLKMLGGFDESSLTEDCDLGMKLICSNHTMKIDYSIKSYEQPAINISDWWNQRVRWTRGSMSVLKKYMKIYSAETSLNRKTMETVLLYSISTGGLLFSIILMGFMGFMMYMNVITPVILYLCCAPLSILFASESIHEFREGRGSLLDLLLSIFVRPWVIYIYSLVGVYALVTDIISGDRIWHQSQRI
jgi:cellulose synthase/poly-beta-1,6-N-acetylglucosamine synthase-like glycosyltransferase